MWARPSCQPISRQSFQVASLQPIFTWASSSSFISSKEKYANEAGDFIYIKPGVPHEVFNMSDTEPVVAFVARSSANEWDEIIPYDRNEGR